MSTRVRFDRFYTYAELTETLDAWAVGFPNLEGTIRNWDGVTGSIATALEGLDLNRNWPADWAPEGEQPGAGLYPTSEPQGARPRPVHRRPPEHHQLHRLPHV